MWWDFQEEQTNKKKPNTRLLLPSLIAQPITDSAIQFTIAVLGVHLKCNNSTAIVWVAFMVFISCQTRIFPKTISCHVSQPGRHSAEMDVTPTLNKTYTYLKPNLQETDRTHSLQKWGIHYFVLEPQVLTLRSLLNKFTLTYLEPQGIPATGKCQELPGIPEP